MTVNITQNNVTCTAEHSSKSNVVWSIVAFIEDKIGKVDVPVENGPVDDNTASNGSVYLVLENLFDNIEYVYRLGNYIVSITAYELGGTNRYRMTINISFEDSGRPNLSSPITFEDFDLIYTNLL
ncbi:hypothetical protein GGF41_002471 [Coemansia sp. RSA 2531]|nr:hypothetical protein GGF41_002471 [Coemansia sp. RSA 2531]